MPRLPTSTTRPKLLAPSAVFSVRLKQARERLALTQEELATRAGIDEFSASARISQYETGKHVPRYEIACRLADVLDVPAAFLYAREEAVAQLLLHWQAASAASRQQLLVSLRK
jgi:transcriptional regulator with XRE-family HTH domain